MHRLRSNLLCLFLLLVILPGSRKAWAVDNQEAVKAQWHVVAQQGEPWPSYWLVNKQHPKLKQEMFVAGPIANDRPWISDVREVNKEKRIYLIVYYAGQPGKHELVDTYYALIYDAKNITLLGHYPYRRTSRLHDYSPKWIFEKHRIRIIGDDIKPAVINY